MGRIALLCTDFDGTLTSIEDKGRCIPELSAALQAIRENGALWLINTGRSLQHAIEGISQLEAPFSPDFLVVNERHIFQRNGKNSSEAASWEPLRDWNQTCDLRHEELYQIYSEAFEEVRKWAAIHPQIQLWEPDGRIEGVVADSESSMDLLVDFLLTLRQSFPLLSFQRNSVYLRFCHCDYHKGSTLLRVAQEIGIASTSILAAGDNHNDLQMLDPTYAGYLVCPSNSVPEVRAKVALHAPFGFISSKKFGAGTAEGIWKFLQ